MFCSSMNGVKIVNINCLSILIRLCSPMSLQNFILVVGLYFSARKKILSLVFIMRTLILILIPGGIDVFKLCQD